MRTSRLCLVGVVILALVGGMSVIVAAQDDGDPPLVTHVTGTRLSTSVMSRPEEWSESEDWVAGGVLYQRGGEVEHTVEWSDPRLPSRLLARTNANWHGTGDGAVGGFAIAVRLVGEEGEWVGTEYSLLDSLSPESRGGLYVLTGSGAYEGLWAMLEGSLVVDADGNPVLDADGYVRGTYDGYIFESEMPPMPDPIEPAE